MKEAWFTDKKKLVDAIQFSGKNTEYIREWSRNVVQDTGGDVLSVICDEGFKDLHQGDWVLWDPRQDSFDVMAPDKFKATHQKVEP